mgnify:CR=1 FL=1
MLKLDLDLDLDLFLYTFILFVSRNLGHEGLDLRSLLDGVSEVFVAVLGDENVVLDAETVSEKLLGHISVTCRLTGHRRPASTG